MNNGQHVEAGERKKQQRFEDKKDAVNAPRIRTTGSPINGALWSGEFG
jgi:hypothetical protein